MENEQVDKGTSIMVALPPDLNAWLEREKAKTRESKTTILRSLIREKIAAESNGN